MRHRPSPISVPYLPRDALNRVIGRILQLPQQLCEQLRPLRDDIPKVAGNFACHRQQKVRILAQLPRQAADGCLRRRRDLVSLDLAQVRRLNPNALSNLPHREGPVFLESLIANGTYKLAKCHVYYIVHDFGSLGKRIFVGVCIFYTFEEPLLESSLEPADISFQPGISP